MRGTRWLLLVAIAAILGGVGLTYRSQRRLLRQNAPPKPQPLPPELSSYADKFRHTQWAGNRKVYEAEADQYRVSKDSSIIDFKGLRLKLYSEDASEYDLVTSAAATLTNSDGRLYSDGDVQIAVGLPVEGKPKHGLVTIQTSGVSFEIGSNRAQTDRPATFVFTNGEGRSTGASYDAMTHELFMLKDVELNWHPPGPNAKPMKIEASSLTYKEEISEIWLKPWGRLTRGAMVVEGQEDVIGLADSPDGGRYIQRIEANHATGTDAYSGRDLKYGAGNVHVEFNPNGEIQTITGAGDARLDSTASASRTSVTADRVQMSFDTAGGESTLNRVEAVGSCVVTSKPLPTPGRQLPETHILRSNSVVMNMRPGGKDVENIVTRAPGNLEFLPNRPAQHHRTLDGDNMVIAYAPENTLESFRATGVKTVTDPTADERKRGRTVAVTRSRDMTARFDPKTGRLSSMEQNGDFNYQEGDRRAASGKARLDSGANVIFLDEAARVWDAAGSTAADHIRLDQESGDFTAEGQVKSSRLPDKDPRKNSGMLSGDAPLQAQARKMRSTNGNKTIHYEGDASMWQGADSVRGNAIDVDRDKRTLVADGDVTTRLWEQPKTAAASKGEPAAAVLTVTRAARLVYTDQDRLATYTGGVTLDRGALRVKSRELRAWLSAPGAESSLDRAFADGAVDIVQSAPGRTRKGDGGHAEYYAGEQKIVLRGVPARLSDSLKGVSEGPELTYWVNDDRLLGSGTPNEPVKSRVIRK